MTHTHTHRVKVCFGNADISICQMNKSVVLYEPRDIEMFLQYQKFAIALNFILSLPYATGLYILYMSKSSENSSDTDIRSMQFL